MSEERRGDTVTTVMHQAAKVLVFALMLLAFLLLGNEPLEALAWTIGGWLVLSMTSSRRPPLTL